MCQTTSPKTTGPHTDVIAFALRLSNTAPVTGIALQDNTTFLGWVQRGTVRDQLERRLEDGNNYTWADHKHGGFRVERP